MHRRHIQRCCLPRLTTKGYGSTAQGGRQARVRIRGTGVPPSDSPFHYLSLPPFLGTLPDEGCARGQQCTVTQPHPRFKPLQNHGLRTTKHHTRYFLFDFKQRGSIVQSTLSRGEGVSSTLTRVDNEKKNRHESVGHPTAPSYPHAPPINRTPRGSSVGMCACGKGRGCSEWHVGKTKCTLQHTASRSTCD